MKAPAAARRLLAKERRGEPIALRDALAACPFRTLLGRASPTSHDITHDQLANALLNNVAAVIALIEPTPTPIDPDVMRDVLTDLVAGRTVLLIASHRVVRDHARQEILSWAGPARGAA